VTPRELANNTDPVQLLALAKRCAFSYPYLSEAIATGSQDKVVKALRDINARLPKGRQIRHGLIQTPAELAEYEQQFSAIA